MTGRDDFRHASVQVAGFGTSQYYTGFDKSKLEPRIIRLQARAHHEALSAARQRQKPEVFRSQYAARAGIEATHEQAIRRCGMRRRRYIGQAKTRLQHVRTATAVNLVRLNDWWTATPHAETRVPHFAALAQAA